MSKAFRKTSKFTGHLRLIGDGTGGISRRKVLYRVNGFWSVGCVSVAQDRYWKTGEWRPATIEHSAGGRDGTTTEVTAARAFAAAMLDAADVAQMWNREAVAVPVATSTTEEGV